MSQPIFLDVRAVQMQIAALRYSYPEMEEDAKLLEDSLEGQTDFVEVITRLVRFERDADASASAVKAQEESLADRRARHTRRQQIYRTMIQNLMDAGGQRTVRLPEATLSISSGRAGCVITDESALPDQFVKIERIPKKSEITAALLAGEQVQGAEMKNPQAHLQIRI